MQTEYHWQCPIRSHGGARGTFASANNALWRHCADCGSNIGRKLCKKGNVVNAELRPCWSAL